MANTMKRIFSLILAVSMVMSLLAVGASATGEEEKHVEPANQQQVEYAGGSTTNGDGVTVSKTIEGTDDENVFDITLKVDTQKSIKEVYRKAQSTAVVIVMDVSHTMKEKFGNSNRYEAAVAAASSFMTSFAAIENPANAERKIGFVAFNTDAHEIFGMSSCVNSEEAADLIKTMDTKADTIIGANDFCGGHDGYCADANISKCNYYSAHSKASNKDYSARFTNIEAGLKMGADMLATSGAVNQYIVFLSDGFPTTYLVNGRDDYAGYYTYCSSGKVGKDGVFYDQKTGKYCDYGVSYSDKGAERAQTMAANIKAAGAKIYSIGVNVEGQSIQTYVDQTKGKGHSVVDCYAGEGYVISDFKAWLRNSIGSGYYWDSNNASQMNAAFAEILAAIKDSVETNSQASWVASDPMNALNTTAIDFLQFYDKDGNLVNGNLAGPADSENTASFVNDAIDWDLKNSVYTTSASADGKTTTYHYELKYRVRLANEAEGFVEKEDVETNGTTTLNYQYVETVNGKETLSEVKSVDFPIPEVEGYLADFSFKKTDTSGNGLAGATFTLTHKSECKVCGHLVNANLKFPACYTAVSGGDGTVTFTNVPSGHDYILEETVAPKGYVLNNTKYDVSVDYDVISVEGFESFEAVTNTELNKLLITKEVDVAEVTGTNVQADMLAEAVLAGTTFAFDVVGVKDGQTVYDAEHSITVAAVTTGEGEEAVTEITGSIELTDLPDGTYTITEKGEGTYTYSGATYTVAAVYNGNNVELSDGDEVTVTVENIYTYNPEYVQVDVAKVWDDANNQDGKRPASITYNLFADADTTDDVAAVLVESKTATSEGNWAASFIRLPKYENGKEIYYTITEDEVPGYSASVDGYVVTNSHTPETTSVSGVKTWNDNDNQDNVRPVSITVRLLANGNEVAGAVRTVSEATDWSYSWDNLPKYAAGQLIRYTVVEDPVEGYVPVYSGCDIENHHTPATVQVDVTKVWDDANNQDGVRPSSITINLLADGVEVAEQEVTAADNWAVSFKDLPKYKDGVEITYTITEDAVSGYSASVDGYVVTNSHIPETTSVSGVKTWNDNDNQDNVRPTFITVRLYANGNEVAGAVRTVSEATDWSYSWDNLPKYAAGQLIRYTVVEDPVEGYIPVYSGCDIENHHTPATVQVDVTKVWDDANNQDGARPSSITINLLADGVEVAEQEVTAADNWAVSFKNLPKYKDGVEITYTITEDAVSGYSASVDGFVVTNSYTPETTSIRGIKTWNDENDADGKRPASIDVNLLANGEVYKTATVSANTNWAYSWSNLPVYEAGQKIAYSVQEVLPEGSEYAPSYNGYDITNNYTPGKTTFTVTKEWADANDQDGIRPASIMVQLYANGDAYGEPVELNADNWSYTWTGLNINEDGRAITYTVDEVEVPSGYTKKVEGGKITNTHVPAVTSASVTKVWDESARGREQAVSVQLLANGVAYGDPVELSEDVQWTYTWTNLPLNANGRAIVYSVSELDLGEYWTSLVEEVPGSINSWTITNSYDRPYVPQYTSVTVNKVWVDNNNAQELRPDSIAVQLYANGNAYGAAVELDDANGWRYTWTGLPLGTTYTVDEVNVPAGYEKSISDYTITNTLIEEELEEEDPPLSNLPGEEEFEEEDVPLADVPSTGDSTALWAAVSVVAVISLVFFNKKNKDED